MTAASASRQAPCSRAARSVRSRAICRASTSGSIWKRGRASFPLALSEKTPDPFSANLFTPTTIDRPASIACCARRRIPEFLAGSSPLSIAASVPPLRSIRVQDLARVPFDRVRQRLDRRTSRPTGSTVLATPLSAAMICCVLSASLRAIPRSAAPAPRRGRCSGATASRRAPPPAPGPRRGRCCCRAAAR